MANINDISLDQRIKLFSPRIELANPVRVMSQVEETFYKDAIRDDLKEAIKQGYKKDDTNKYMVFNNGNMVIRGFIYEFKLNEEDIKIKNTPNFTAKFGFFIYENKKTDNEVKAFIEVDQNHIDFNLLDNGKEKEFGRSLFKLLR